MVYIRSYFFKIFFLAGIFCLINLPRTDADLVDSVRLLGNYWSAATLDLSQSNTINNASLQSLFIVNDLLPQGLAVGSFRLRNSGNSRLVYSLKTLLADPDNPLCQNLYLKLLNSDQIKYQGKLANLDINFQSDINIFNDWIAFVSLPVSDSGLKNVSCEFTFDIQASSANANSKFTDREIITNRISTGFWD